MLKGIRILFTARILAPALTAVLIAYCIFGGAPVQGGWLQKGVDLLKGSKTGATQALSTDEIGAGLKEALRVGSENVVTRLGRVDGFNLDPAVHIPLPKQFETVRSVLDRVDMTAMLDDLELRLNRAAEVAAPKAGALFSQAIAEMTFEDVKNIYNGPEDAATRHFQEKMTPSLAREMQPVVEESLAEVGAVRAYDRVMGQYRAVPFVPDVKADLTNHVVDKGMDGIFHYMAVEEAAIRRDPAKRTTELLQRVFGRP